MDCGGKEKQGKKGKSKHVGGSSDHGHVEHHEYAAKYALPEDLPEDLRLKIIGNSPDEDNYFKMLTKAVTNKNLYSLDERALIVQELVKLGNPSMHTPKSFKDEAELKNYLIESGFSQPTITPRIDELD
uniref:DUF4145 domain-containing protein n=1 Tax=Meloidogyne javanica TaxID=6303 RepID=A0A915N0B1_MELJA